VSENLRELYADLLLEHSRSPSNFKKLESPTTEAEGFNPLCGDKVTVQLKDNAGAIASVGISGQGCAISIASASIMSELVKAKEIREAIQLAEQFVDFMADRSSSLPMEDSDLSALKGVKRFPMRVKCATLAWHALLAALSKQRRSVSTE